MAALLHPAFVSNLPIGIDFRILLTGENAAPTGKTGRRFAEYAENGKKNLSKTDG